MAIFALLAAPIAAGNFLSVFSQLNVDKAGRFAALTAGLLFAGVVSYFAVGLMTNDYYRSRKLYGFHTGSGISSVYLPVEAVKAFQELHIQGNGFHNYHLGGYLMHSPECGAGVFLDGRLLHYPKAVRDDYKTLKGEPDKWFTIAAKPEYKFEWAMLAHTTGEFRALIKTLWKNAEWQPIYTDSVVIMFVRRSGINSELVKKGVPAQLLDVSGMEYPEYHYRQLGRLFTDLEQYAQAKQNLSKAEDLPYASPDVEIDLGRVFLLTGEIEKAREKYTSVRFKAQYESNLGLGHVDLAMSPPDLEFARRHFEQALQHRPRSVEAHLGLARVAIARDRMLEAERQVEMALEIDPHSAEALKLNKKLNIQSE
jgi:tetratricopeptide (TPR) repeat protein